jgi:glycopeptide antibiotics resistance protein
VLAVLSVLYLGFLAWVTLNPSPPQPSANPLLWQLLGAFARHRATAWLTYDAVEFLANIALFLPVGALVLLLFGRRWWWLGIIIGAALTCSIEFTQQFLPARVPDVRDLVANTTGAAIGALLTLAITTPAAIRHARARRSAVG